MLTKEFENNVCNIRVPIVNKDNAMRLRLTEDNPLLKHVNQNTFYLYIWLARFCMPFSLRQIAKYGNIYVMIDQLINVRLYKTTI